MQVHIISMALVVFSLNLLGMDIEKRKQEKQNKLMALTQRITKQPSSKQNAGTEIICATQLLRSAILADEAYYTTKLKEQLLPSEDRIEALQAQIKNEQLRNPTLNALRLIEALASDPQPSYSITTFYHLSCAIGSIVHYPLKYNVDLTNDIAIAKKYDEQLPTQTDNTAVYVEFMNDRVDLWQK